MSNDLINKITIGGILFSPIVVAVVSKEHKLRNSLYTIGFIGLCGVVYHFTVV